MHLPLIPVGDKSRDGAMDQGDDAPAINLKQHEVPRQTGINLFVCALSHKMAPIQFYRCSNQTISLQRRHRLLGSLLHIVRAEPSVSNRVGGL